MILLIACRMSRFISKVVNGARLDHASILDRMCQDSVTTGWRFIVRSFNYRIDPGEAIFLLRRRAFLGTFRRFLFAFRMYVKFVVSFVRASSRLAMHFVGANMCPIVRRLPGHARFQVANFPFRRRLAHFVRRQKNDFHLFLQRTFLRRLYCFDFMVLVRDSVVVACRVVTFFT